MNYLLLIILMILLSAFFSGMEIAFISANKLRLEIDKHSDPFSSKLLKFVTSNSGHYIATMLIGNNIALVIYGIAFSALLSPVFQLYFQSEMVILILQTLFSTLVILILAEYLPKVLFRISPNSSLNFLAIPLAIFYLLFYPITKITIWITNSFLKIIFKNKKNLTLENPVFNRIDLDEFVNPHKQQNSKTNLANDKEVKLFRNALDFSKVKLREIMVPRTEIEMMDVKSTIQELKQKFIETGYSRVLLFEDNIDNVVGYIHSSVMFRNPDSLDPYIQKVLIVPESMPANKLLGTFIKEHRNIAIVVDEFGGTSGMVTSEDILEEIFGEIEDEHDTIDIIQKKINDNEFIFSGRSEIDLLNEKYNFGLPENEEFETIAGLILFNYESIPKINTEIKIDKFLFKILKTTNTKIELVKLTLANE